MMERHFLRQKALAYLFPDGKGGTFTTLDYVEAVRFILKRSSHSTPGCAPLISYERELEELPHVIVVGNGKWLATDSRLEQGH